MTYQVKNIKTGSVYHPKEEENILAAAQREGHVLASSCRNGQCGTCKVKLHAGEVIHDKYQETAITQKEIDDGWILACQAIARSDLEITAAELPVSGIAPIRTLPCRVKSRERICHDVIELVLQLPNNQSIDFIAGQYIEILLRDGRRRSFSMANFPGETAMIHLHVRHVEKGHFTTFVFDGLKERDLLRIRGPLGTFFVRKNSKRPILMIGGGTGIAPLRSMILDLIESGDTARIIHLFHGVRKMNDLYMDEEIKQWIKNYPNLLYSPVLSEAEKNDNWTGSTGWVHDAVIAAYPDLRRYEVYASGPPPMIDAMQAVFPQQQLSAEHFFFDSFEFDYSDK